MFSSNAKPARCVTYYVCIICYKQTYLYKLKKKKLQTNNIKNEKKKTTMLYRNQVKENMFRTLQQIFFFIPFSNGSKLGGWVRRDSYSVRDENKIVLCIHKKKCSYHGCLCLLLLFSYVTFELIHHWAEYKWRDSLHIEVAKNAVA